MVWYAERVANIAVLVASYKLVSTYTQIIVEEDRLIYFK